MCRHNNGRKRVHRGSRDETPENCGESFPPTSRILSVGRGSLFSPILFMPCPVISLAGRSSFLCVNRRCDPPPFLCQSHKVGHRKGCHQRSFVISTQPQSVHQRGAIVQNVDVGPVEV